MISGANRFAPSLMTIAALLTFSGALRAQRLENFQTSPGQPHQCSGHSSSPGARESRLKASKQKSRSSQMTVQPAVSSIRTVSQPELPEVVAARQLNLAKELAVEADLAFQNQEPARAGKLRERVSERLLDLVEKYGQTDAAGKALAVLEQERASRPPR